MLDTDVIFVLGSRLADLRLNTYLKEARRARPALPILSVGYWGNRHDALFSSIYFEHEDLGISLFHDLRTDLINSREEQFQAVAAIHFRRWGLVPWTILSK